MPSDIVEALTELAQKNNMFVTREFDFHVGRIPVRGSLKTKRELIPKSE